MIIPDHYIFTADERANRNVDILRDFCTEENIKYFYDIKDLGNFKVCCWWFVLLLCICIWKKLDNNPWAFQANPDYKGVCHVALAQEGHCRPGEVLTFNYELNKIEYFYIARETNLGVPCAPLGFAWYRFSYMYCWCIWSICHRYWKYWCRFRARCWEAFIEGMPDVLLWNLYAWIKG